MFGSQIKKKIRMFLGPEMDEKAKELRKKEDEIENENRNFEEEFDIAPVGIVNLNTDWKIRKANLASGRMFMCHPELMKGRTVLSYIASESANTFLEHIHKAIEAGKRQMADIKMRNIHGEVFTTRCDIEPLSGGQGNISGLRLFLIL